MPQSGSVVWHGHFLAGSLAPLGVCRRLRGMRGGHSVRGVRALPDGIYLRAAALRQSVCAAACGTCGAGSCWVHPATDEAGLSS